MPIEKVNEYGSIKIDDHVISTIAGISAMESYGIVGMAAKDATDGLFELIRWDNLSKGVKVSVEDSQIDIDLHVILEYGVKISVVAENIIDRVKFNLENLTGLKINNVNIHVEGIRVGK